MTRKFYAHGKLLLTAEYFVLDGALALALPTRPGQSLELNFSQNEGGLDEKNLFWKSLDEKGDCWFEAGFGSENFEILQTSDTGVATRLQQILTEARRLNPYFLPDTTSPALTATCRLDFSRNWGLGTSSTLIYLVAAWAEVDPFELQFRTFGGSGYDIACAGAKGPILYFLENGKPHTEPCNFQPPFSNLLYFIYLGKKQDSRKGIARYREADGSRQVALEEITELTKSFLRANTLSDFEKLIVEHEKIVSEMVGIQRARDLYFPDFWGEIKSLGAWGGDFVLTTSDRPADVTQQYFVERGFDVFLPYNDLIISKM